MEILKPQNDIVLCTLASSNEKTTSTGFVYKSNDVQLYKVESIGHNVKDSHLDLHIGDLIRTNSTGTQAKLNDVEYYLFKSENIAGKVVENG